MTNTCFFFRMMTLKRCFMRLLCRHTAVTLLCLAVVVLYVFAYLSYSGSYHKDNLVFNPQFNKVNVFWIFNIFRKIAKRNFPTILLYSRVNHFDRLFCKARIMHNHFTQCVKNGCHLSAKSIKIQKTKQNKNNSKEKTNWCHFLDQSTENPTSTVPRLHVFCAGYKYSICFN